METTQTTRTEKDKTMKTTFRVSVGGRIFKGIVARLYVLGERAADAAKRADASGTFSVDDWYAVYNNTVDEEAAKYDGFLAGDLEHILASTYCWYGSF